MDLKELYRKICLTRAFENKLSESISRGLVQGTAHLSIGQEFIPHIISQHLLPGDIFTSTHRGHSHAIAKGLDIKRLAAELMGKKEGYNSGRGGTQHVISSENGYYANGVTGGMAPVAAGIAFANKQKKNGNIVVCFVGDGAMNEGYVLESLNLSAVFQLPILFVCENNGYAMSTSVKKSFKGEINKRAASFGLKSTLILDNDFKQLDFVSSQFVSELRNFSQPAFIEVLTYRQSGHSKNDKNVYRTKEEMEIWMEKDVLKKIGQELIQNFQSNPSELAEINHKCEEEIENIFKEASKENPPVSRSLNLTLSQK